MTAYDVRCQIPNPLEMLALAEVQPAVNPLEIPNHLLASHRQLLSREPDGVRLLANSVFLQHVTADSSSHLGNGASETRTASEAHASRGSTA